MQGDNKYRSFLNQGCASAMWEGKPGWMLITGGGSTKHTFLLIHDRDQNNATIKRLNIDMIYPRINHEMVFCNGSFYVLGGESYGKATRKCERLIINAETFEGKWVEISSMV